MQNYKEQVASGEIKSWIRAKRVLINNELNQLPDLTFTEEKVTIYPNGDIQKIGAGALREEYNTERVINLINPENGQPIGQTVTLLELQIILFSYYLALATERDQSNGG